MIQDFAHSLNCKYSAEPYPSPMMPSLPPRHLHSRKPLREDFANGSVPVPYEAGDKSRLVCFALSIYGTRPRQEVPYLKIRVLGLYCMGTQTIAGVLPDIFLISVFEYFLPGTSYVNTVHSEPLKERKKDRK